MAFPILQGLFKYDIIDHYAVLGVPLIADGQQIRQQYLNVAYRLHPDTCKAKSAIEKEKANQLLSKWVNPAYEQLSKERNRTDYLLVLAQIGKNVALESGKITLASAAAKELFQAGRNVELVYLKLIQPLVTDQYTDLDRAFQYIAQISELNLVYLILKQGQGIGAKTQPQAPVRDTATSKTTQTTSKAEEETKASPVAGYLRRAQDYLQKGQPDRAILELRDALKLSPNEAICHGLLGLAYLQQSQVTMAKVHITKAWEANPKDPLVIKAKQELDKVTTTDSQTSSPSGSGGLFGLFGGKKK